MPNRADQRELAREKLLDAAGRGFRREGFGGIGVDGLAKEAGVTSGAFYGYFKSKREAFATAAVAGLEALRDAVGRLQSEQGERWLDVFIDFYFGERLTCDLDESCALQSMTPDVMRADEATKVQYESALKEVAESIADGLGDGSIESRMEAAWALLALLSGGVTMARSTATDALRKDLSAQLKHAARTMTETIRD